MREPNRASGRLIHSPLPAFPVLFPQTELLKLSGGGARKRGNEINGRRTFEVSDVFPAEGDELLFAGVLPLSLDDQRLRSLAPLLVRYTDHGALSPFQYCSRRRNF